MLTHSAERLLPYSSEQLFDLAADVERYPEFLPGWFAAHVRKQEGQTYWTDQVIGLGPVRTRFASKTVLHRPERIDVTSEEPPFRRFKLTWLFRAGGNARCQVSLAAELELQSYVLERIVAQALPAVVDDIVAAFEVRAGRLYGQPTFTSRPYDPKLPSSRGPACR